MKKILIPLFSLIISFNAYGKWEVVASANTVDNNKSTYYMDFDNIKVNGNVYFWEIEDQLKPDRFGDLSNKALFEVDCNVPQRSRMLSVFYYTQPMAEGSISDQNNKPYDWKYTTPGSVGEAKANIACNFANQ
jgi:hypothetical protein